MDCYKVLRVEQYVHGRLEKVIAKIVAVEQGRLGKIGKTEAVG